MSEVPLYRTQPAGFQNSGHTGVPRSQETATPSGARFLMSEVPL